MSELVFVVDEAPEGGYVARAVGAAIVTEADDLDGLRAQVRDAVRCHFDAGQAPTAAICRFRSPDGGGGR